MKLNKVPSSEKVRMAASSQRPDPLFANPKKFAEAGEKIYNERYRVEYEKEYKGQFVAVDVATEKAYVSDAAEHALESGRKANPNGIFHLIRIGSPAAYKSSYSLNVNSDRFV